MNPLILVLLLLAPGQSAAPQNSATECNPAGNQMELNICAWMDQDSADDDLNEAYKAVLARYADDPVFIARLKVAQRLWVQLRDADLQAQFPLAEGDNPRVQFGSIYPLEHAQATAAITRARTRYLRETWLDSQTVH